MLFSPVSLSCVCPRFASSSHLLRTRNRAVGATRAQHGLHRYTSPRILSLSHTHTHTHTLSLSLCGSGITTTHTAPRPAPCTFSLWDVARILSYQFRTHTRTPTPQYNPVVLAGCHLCNMMFVRHRIDDGSGLQARPLTLRPQPSEGSARTRTLMHLMARLPGLPGFEPASLARTGKECRINRDVHSVAFHSLFLS